MKIKKVEDLCSINDDVVNVIKEHLEKTKQTPTGFAITVGVHPLQLLGFLRRERGMHIDTIAKIGKRLKESKV